MEEHVLVARHLPASLSLATTRKIFAHFGAQEVERSPSEPSTALAKFSDAASALSALRQLHRVRILGSVISVHYLRPQHTVGEPQPPPGPSAPKDAPTEAIPAPPAPSGADGGAGSKAGGQEQGQGGVRGHGQGQGQGQGRGHGQVQGQGQGGTQGQGQGQEVARPALGTRFEVHKPTKPERRHPYPSPTDATLNNIRSAMLAVPSFYEQVLQLMDRMNLPPPFASQLPPLGGPGAPDAQPLQAPTAFAGSHALGSAGGAPVASEAASGVPPGAAGTADASRLPTVGSPEPTARAVGGTKGAQLEEEEEDEESEDEGAEWEVGEGRGAGEGLKRRRGGNRLESAGVKKVALMPGGPGTGKARALVTIKKRVPILPVAIRLPTKQKAGKDEDEGGRRTGREEAGGDGGYSRGAPDVAPQEKAQGPEAAGDEEEEKKEERGGRGEGESGGEKGTADASGKDSGREGADDRGPPRIPTLTAKDLLQGRMPAEELAAQAAYKGDDKGLPVQEAQAEKYSRGTLSALLYVKNIAKAVSEEELMDVFGAAAMTPQIPAPRVSVRLMKEGRMKGQAFITFDSEEEATRALDEANGYVLHGKPLVASFGRGPKG